MRVGNLFNGIGGFALAAHWMGWENIMHCEIDPFCNKVMNYHFPNSVQHEDIRTTDFAIWRGKLDLITGGFPCQPYSTAGKRKGKEDDRHLWPQMLRAIREIQPGWIVGENVRGLTNWNGGLVFDEVQADLEAEGYEVLPFLLPACAVNAPHRRDRIWFIAYAGCLTGDRRESIRPKQSIDNGQNGEREETADKSERLCKEKTGANSECLRLSVGDDQQDRRQSQSIIERYRSAGYWKDFPAQPLVCGRNDGLSGGLADIAIPSKTGIRMLKGKQAYGKWRNESIKALGNAVVPQLVYQIFKAIEQYARQTS